MPYINILAVIWHCFFYNLYKNRDSNVNFLTLKFNLAFCKYIYSL